MDDTRRELVRSWLTKAASDLRSARLLGAAEEAPLDTAIYHCQQGAEKAVKAFLIYHGQPYEKTHDIEVLLDFACEINSKFSALADAADALTPYATRFRYPNATFAVEPQPGEYHEALQHAQSVYEFVLNLLPTDARP